MEAARSIRPIEIKEIKYQRPVLEMDRERTLMVAIADPHYGKLISVSGLHGEELNTYSPEIFESRMEQLLDDIRRLASFHRPRKIVIPNLGDSIDGMFRTGQLMAIRYGTIDSCMFYSEYMANWLNEVSEIAPVDYFHVCGNHDTHRPVVNKKGEFPKENFGKIMAWWMSERLSENDSVKVSLIEKIGMIDVCGNNILLIHGDNESKTSDAAKEYSFLYNVRVDMVLRGHLHTYSDVGVGTNEKGVDIREIYVPSICGVDEFAMSIKRRSSAGAVAMLLERKEDRIVFPIRLK